MPCFPLNNIRHGCNSLNGQAKRVEGRRKTRTKAFRKGRTTQQFQKWPRIPKAVSTVNLNSCYWSSYATHFLSKLCYRGNKDKVQRKDSQNVAWRDEWGTKAHKVNIAMCIDLCSSLWKTGYFSLSRSFKYVPMFAIICLPWIMRSAYKGTLYLKDPHITSKALCSWALDSHFTQRFKEKFKKFPTGTNWSYQFKELSAATVFTSTSNKDIK